MLDYFAKYPTIGYSLDGSTTVAARDILRRVKIADALAEDYLIFYPYTIRDGDTPENIASKLYGSPRLHFIVLLVNNILDRYCQWPLTSDQLAAKMQKRYGTSTVDGLQYAMQTVHHYEDSYGNQVDLDTYNSLPATQRQAVSIYDHEVTLNEAKRSIRLLDKRFAQQFDAEATKLLSA